MERLLVEDLFRPNSEPSQLDELAQRLRPRGELRQVWAEDDKDRGVAAADQEA